MLAFPLLQHTTRQTHHAALLLHTHARAQNRFFHAKTTLESAREQAKRTDKWRQKMGVDTVLMRPCPKFPLMCRLMPTYLLADESPEGHAVLLMKVCVVFVAVVCL